MTTEFILSQVIVVISYIFTAMTYIVKNRKWLLIYSFISLVMMGLSYFFLSAWSGFAMTGVAILRNIIFLVQNKKENDKSITAVDWVILAVLVAIQIGLSVWTYDGPLSMLSVLATMIYTISVWQKNITAYNILGIFCNLSWIAYDIFVGSIFAIVCETILLIVMIINLIIKQVKKSQNKTENAENIAKNEADS